MGDAKRLIVKPISATDANRIVRALHYSGKVVNNSQVHLGVFMDGRCGGAMQFGPSLDKRKIHGLVAGTRWNEFIELNRMAFADWLPRNGESRCIGYAMRWLRKTYPWLKWVVSFADGTQCGDGTIYRASGFVLTGINKNTTCWVLPDGGTVCDNDMKSSVEKRRKIMSRVTLSKVSHTFIENGAASMRSLRAIGGHPLPGFQLRYIYFLDPTARKRLTVPILPFSDIDRLGAGMYRGKKRVVSDTSDTPGDQPGEGGATPTTTLQHPKTSK